MAQAFNPNPLSVNGMGVAVQARPVPTEEQALRDTLDVLRNSLLMMEGEPDLAAECAEVRASIRAIEEHLSMSREAERHAYDADQDAAYVAVFGTPKECYHTDQGVMSTLSIESARHIIPAGRCPICGLSLTAHPHSESECQDLIQYDEMRFYDAGAELAQARIDYRLGC